MILGNEKQKKFLEELLFNFEQATILLIGPEGVGKFSLVKELLKGKKDWEIIFLQAEDKNFKIETARLIASLSNYKTKKRIVVVDDIHKFQLQAQNTLLKTLEEAPSKTIFILITHRLQRVLTTIRSRSILIKFNLVDKEKVFEFLKAQGYQSEEIEMAYQFYPGQPGKMLRFLETKNKINLFRQFMTAPIPGKLSLLEELKNYFSLTEFLEYYLLWLRKNSLESKNILLIKKLLDLYGESENNLNFEIQLTNLILHHG